MKAGVYDDLSNADYRDATEWLSASKLKRYLPDQYKPITTTDRAGLDFGVAFHTTVLGAGQSIVPVTASDWRTNAAKAERAAAYEMDAIPLLPPDMERVEAMRDAVLAHPQARTLFEAPGRPELSVFAEVDGVKCRARFDRVVGSTGVELKSTTDIPNPEALARSAVRFGYELAADHFLRTASTAGLDVDSFVFVFVGKEPPHYVTVVELDESFYERAAVLRDLALERIQHPEMVSAYPGANERLVVELPRWARLGA